MDATVRINEDYGETVPTNSQSTHETKNDGSGGNDNCASIDHGHVPHSMHPFQQVFRFDVILALFPHHVVF